MNDNICNEDSSREPFLEKGAESPSSPGWHWESQETNGSAHTSHGSTKRSKSLSWIVLQILFHTFLIALYTSVFFLLKRKGQINPDDATCHFTKCIDSLFLLADSG